MTVGVTRWRLRAFWSWYCEFMFCRDGKLLRMDVRPSAAVICVLLKLPPSSGWQREFGVEFSRTNSES